MEKIKEIVLREKAQGNIVFAGFDALHMVPLSEFIKQSSEGILYDLNRSEAVVLAFIEEPKWVNDFAVAQVIRALKSRIEELESNPSTTESV